MGWYWSNLEGGGRASQGGRRQIWGPFRGSGAHPARTGLSGTSTARTQASPNHTRHNSPGEGLGDGPALDAGLGQLRLEAARQRVGAEDVVAEALGVKVDLR